MTTSMETYTHQELDELGGALLFIGGVHTMLGLLLDTTKYKRDIRMVEWLNHAPPGMVDELLPATATVLTEAIGRLQELQTAVDSALESKAARALDEDEAVSGELRAAFDELMSAEFGDEQKKNGG